MSLAVAEPLTRPPPGASGALIDRFHRRIDHLRISVTSACDLHCAYCRDRDAPRISPAALDDRQRVELVRFLHVSLGLRQVRLTGGEPLLHSGIVSLIADIRAAGPTLSVAMTTNGRRLDRHAAELRRAGLNRLNVSLDSISPVTYREITGGSLDDVLRGLDASIHAGFPPPKLNMVVLRDVNDSQIADIAGWSLARGHEVRFLEAMSIGSKAAFNARHFVSADEILRRLSEQFSIRPLVREVGDTAHRYEVIGNHARGVVGVIAPVTRPFCGQCRRMRVTADGLLFPCLLDPRHVDLRAAWMGRDFDENTARRLIAAAVADKQAAGQTSQTVPMVKLGG